MNIAPSFNFQSSYNFYGEYEITGLDDFNVEVSCRPDNTSDYSCDYDNISDTGVNWMVQTTTISEDKQSIEVEFTVTNQTISPYVVAEPSFNILLAYRTKYSDGLHTDQDLVTHSGNQVLQATIDSPTYHITKGG